MARLLTNGHPVDARHPKGSLKLDSTLLISITSAPPPSSAFKTSDAKILQKIIKVKL